MKSRWTIAESIGTARPTTLRHHAREVDQAHGFYSHGTLVNFSKFDLEGEGFMKIFVPRDRGYATYDMTQVVAIAASQLAHDYPGGERIQIGDVCAQNGGQLAHHASHQNGLDADIAYMRVNHREQDPQVTTGFDELFVKNGKITANFDEERVWDFIKAIHDTGRLVRIFMDPGDQSDSLRIRGQDRRDRITDRCAPSHSSAGVASGSYAHSDHVPAEQPDLRQASRPSGRHGLRGRDAEAMHRLLRSFSEASIEKLLRKMLIERCLQMRVALHPLVELVAIDHQTRAAVF